jgi:hypothetical protein
MIISISNYMHSPFLGICGVLGKNFAIEGFVKSSSNIGKTVGISNIVLKLKITSDNVLRRLGSFGDRSTNIISAFWRGTSQKRYKYYLRFISNPINFTSAIIHISNYSYPCRSGT